MRGIRIGIITSGRKNGINFTSKEHRKTHLITLKGKTLVFILFYFFTFFFLFPVSFPLFYFFLIFFKCFSCFQNSTNFPNFWIFSSPELFYPNFVNFFQIHELDFSFFTNPLWIFFSLFANFFLNTHDHFKSMIFFQILQYFKISVFSGKSTTFTHYFYLFLCSFSCSLFFSFFLFPKMLMLSKFCSIFQKTVGFFNK